MGNLKSCNTTVHDKPVVLNLGGRDLIIYDLFFFSLHLILGENIWTSADVMTFFFLLFT